MNRIKELRKEQDIKQAELAKYLGVVQGTLSYWENGKFDIDNASLQKLADFFNVSTDYILGRPDIPTSPDAKKEAPTKVEALSVEDRVGEILVGIDSEQTLMLDGNPMSPKAMDSLRNSLMLSVELARKVNKEKEKNDA